MGELEPTFDATAVSYPVRTVSGQLKYYLIFLTRHIAGLLAMSDVIYRVDNQYEREQKDYIQNAPDRRAALTGQAPLLVARRTDGNHAERRGSRCPCHRSPESRYLERMQT